jgi:hypothetical protein
MVLCAKGTKIINSMGMNMKIGNWNKLTNEEIAWELDDDPSNFYRAWKSNGRFLFIYKLGKVYIVAFKGFSQMDTHPHTIGKAKTLKEAEKYANIYMKKNINSSFTE